MTFFSRHVAAIAVGTALGFCGSFFVYLEWPLAALVGMALGTDLGQQGWRNRPGKLPAILLGITLGSIPLWVPVGIGLFRGDLLLTLLFPCLPAILVVFGLGLQLSLMKAAKLRARAAERRRAA